MATRKRNQFVQIAQTPAGRSARQREKKQLESLPYLSGAQVMRLSWLRKQVVIDSKVAFAEDKQRKNPGFFSKTSVAGAQRVKRVHLVKEIYTGEIGELVTQKPALLKEGWVKVKWRNRDKPTLIQESEITPVKAGTKNPQPARPSNRFAYSEGYRDGYAGLVSRPDYKQIRLAQSYREGYAAGEQQNVRDAKRDAKRGGKPKRKANIGLIDLAANIQAADFLRGLAASPKKRRNPSQGGAGAGATSSDVRSPTRTEVRSPTKTSTVAHTRGNITVTGGAGAGATTSVTVRRNPDVKLRRLSDAREAARRAWAKVSLSKPKEWDAARKRYERAALRFNDYRRALHNKALANPSVNALAETFQGRASGATADFKAADSAPANLARIGKLVFLKLRDKRAQISAPGAMVAVDTRGKLWLVSARGGMFTPKAKVKGEALDYGEVDRICYLTAKQHIGNGKATEYVHTFGEDGGKRPHLLVDHDGMPILRGGDYQIGAEGIVN